MSELELILPQIIADYSDTHLGTGKTSAAAQRQGMTIHAFMIQAIEQATTTAELASLIAAAETVCGQESRKSPALVLLKQRAVGSGSPTA